MKVLDELVSYLEQRIKYCDEDISIGVMPGIQDSIELDRSKVVKEELKAMLGFVRNLDPTHQDCSRSSR